MTGPVTLFISPHLDDAVFSCGGYLARLAASGHKLMVITVFTADNPAGTPLSWLARRLSRSWNLGEEPFAARRQEDLQAGKVLGVEMLHLGFLDAVYRRDGAGEPLYPQSITTAPLHTQDLAVLKETLRARFVELTEMFPGRQVRMVSPLGLGGHVDHRIVRLAVEEACSPRDRIYYEDFPYSILARGLESGQNQQVEGLFSHTLRISPAQARLRMDAMACYHSQVAGCFPSRLEILIEILQARLPLVGKHLHYRPDLAASIRRMETRMNDYISHADGERYWTTARDIGLEPENHAE